MPNIQIFSRASVALSQIQPLARDRLPVCHSTLPNCSRCVLQNSLLQTLSGTKSIVREKKKKEEEERKKKEKEKGKHVDTRP